MKSALVLFQATIAAFLLTFTFGCAPPAPIQADTSTDIAPETSSNMTTGGEAPGSNMTTGGDAPAAEAPAE
ncbi:hypothetical protein Poly51_46720 [Rubripirellula tenax]|uniref:Uncharacterized protein n=1 Tax=Rubripirellula tenax TaxID=2528015 RepID=A0A5C6EN64_9BACT|nr:hypothetical protein [Rubripirellula tenax]TWU48769.1 hypothetical protein Poly51_46720 [Rubripirellula tenax]